LDDLIEVCEVVLARGVGFVEIGREMTKGVEYGHV
jgi:hypothetical protein